MGSCGQTQDVCTHTRIHTHELCIYAASSEASVRVLEQGRAAVDALKQFFP